MFSMSKTYGMAGWRLGFVVGNAEIVRAARRCWTTTCAPGSSSPLQEAAIAALTGPQETVEERRALYEARRDRVVAALPGARSEGTFFVWLRLPEGVTVERILEEARVAVAPGEGFGSRGAGYARLSLAVTDEVLDEGLERLGGRWEPRSAARGTTCSMRTFLVALVAAAALLVVPSASAKDFGPGDLRVCNAKRCVPIVEARRAAAARRLLLQRPGALTRRPGSRRSERRTTSCASGTATPRGIVATRQLDRFLSYGVHLERFARDQWYGSPPLRGGAAPADRRACARSASRERRSQSHTDVQRRFVQ